MHQFIDSPDDVIAVKVANKVTGGDLGAVMDRLESVMDKRPKVHIFVETEAIDAIELTSLPSYTARAIPLFGKLDRFGRVAVVADQAWVRFGTRMESKILPGISYRVYEPPERDEALAWVEGKVPD
jgi:hypothetical protein